MRKEEKLIDEGFDEVARTSMGHASYLPIDSSRGKAVTEISIFQDLDELDNDFVIPSAVACPWQ